MTWAWVTTPITQPVTLNLYQCHPNGFHKLSQFGLRASIKLIFHALCQFFNCSREQQRPTHIEILQNTPIVLHCTLL